MRTDMPRLALVVATFVGGLALFVAQADIPAVGQSVVVIPLFFVVDVDADVVDDAVGGPAGIRGPVPDGLRVQVVVDFVQPHIDIAVKIDKANFAENAIILEQIRFQ